MLGTPIRDRQTERREATRAEILDAAWAIAASKGLAEVTLRDVALAIGMQAPSLYSYFPSKLAIYDAMFGQAWTQYSEAFAEVELTLPRSARTAIKKVAHLFFDFAMANPARYQLMNERIIPGFVPTVESYAPAVDVLERMRSHLHGFGVTDPGDVDLLLALVGGLINAQQANDPGGDRWARLLDKGVDMFADSLRLPGNPKRRS
ncbi:MAG TPA: TetR/AcrR family transcriptional regulator [Acidothermaceae bacterium]|jgi:AcrR family transcriptional regulator